MSEKEVLNPNQDLLSLYWPNRTPAKERSDLEDDAIQNWLAAYNSDWETEEDDVVLSALEYEECPAPEAYTGSGTETGHYTSILITAGGDDGFGGNSATADQFHSELDYVEVGEISVMAMMSAEEEVTLSAQAGEVGIDPILGFLTFRNLPFGSKARVNKAIIKVKAYHESDQDQTNAVYVWIAAHCSATTDPPTSKYEILNWVRTWTEKNWDITPTWVANTIYDTPDVGAVIEEVTRLSGWDKGITFLIEDTGAIESDSVRHFHSYESTFPAELQIWWNDTYDEGSTNGVVCGGSASVTSSERFIPNGGVVGGGTSRTIGGAQELNPMSDIDAGTWIVAPLYPKIDETYPDDTDFISSADNPVNSTCEVKLETGLDPQVSTGHVVYYRYSKSDPDYTMNLTVRLFQGASMIAEWNHTNIPFEWAEVEQTLTSVEANSITDYSDLRLKFIANTV